MNNYENIPIEKLLLDPQNPRFATTIEDAKRSFDLTLETIQIVQESRGKELQKTTNFDVLTESIIRHGYVDLDPIVVRRIETSDFFLVIEGNRRICAIQKIRSSTSALALMDATKVDSLRSLKCMVLEDDDSNLINKILGIRHLVSVQEWNSLQKALVIGALYTENPDSQHIASTTGETVIRINRYLRVVFLYNWIIENSEHGDKIKDDATVDIFMVAMSRKNIKDWFGYVENKEHLLDSEFHIPENVEFFAEWVSRKVISTGRFDVNALNRLLLRKNLELVIARIEEGESPQKIEADLSPKEAKWKLHVETVLNSLSEIKVKELDLMSDEDLKLLSELRSMIKKIIDDHAKLVS